MTVTWPSCAHFACSDTLGRCLNTTGGFGGGPQQLAHCATTYAAVATLCIVSQHNDGAWDVLDAIRPTLYAHYMSLLDAASGGLRVHHGGEVDVRAAYLMVSVAYLLGILTPELGNEALVAYLVRCQTYEGGFGGEPCNEAHGGYTYCATAALQIMGQLHRANVPQLTGWLAGRQMACEGGYQGRTHKLVDGCYSFWVGGPAMTVGLTHEEAVAAGDAATCSPPAASGDSGSSGKESGPMLPVALNQQRLGAYILHCCQQYQGGLRDKPTEKRDFYHTCYCLSGLSLCQQDMRGGALPTELVEGGEHNRVGATHPLFNIARVHVRRVVQRYRGDDCALPRGHDDLLAAASAAASQARQLGHTAGGADNTIPLPESASNAHLAGACIVTASGRKLPPPLE